MDFEYEESVLNELLHEMSDKEKMQVSLYRKEENAEERLLLTLRYCLNWVQQSLVLDEVEWNAYAYRIVHSEMFKEPELFDIFNLFLRYAMREENIGIFGMMEVKDRSVKVRYNRYIENMDFAKYDFQEDQEDENSEE